MPGGSAGRSSSGSGRRPTRSPPTFGPTPGHCSLLVCTALQTTVVAGDIVLTGDHFAHAKLESEPWDLAKAKESFQDVLEIADLVVPGHDNVVVCRAGGGLA